MSATLKENHELFASDPENTLAFDALIEHYFFDGESWDELVSLYHHRLTAPSLRDDPRRRVPVLVRLAQILEERCFDVDKALEYYTQAASLDPTCRAALSHLRKIYTRRSQWDLVLQIADVEEQATMEPGERASFCSELGHIWLEELGDHDEALACFERGLEADAANPAALAGLAKTLRACGRAHEAVESMERLVEVQRGTDRAPALVEMGRLLTQDLNDLDRAAECFRRALTSDPSSGDAIDALVENTRGREQWELLTDLLERQFDLAAGARRRAQIATEAGEHHLRRRLDARSAGGWFQRAAELCPEDPTIHAGLAEVARETGDDALLRRALEGLIEHADEPLAPSALLEAANLQSEIGNEVLAARYLEDARRLSPDDPLVLEALSDALTALGRPAELAQVLERRVDLAAGDTESCVDTLVELGRVYEEDLQQLEHSIEAYRRAFETTPDVPTVASHLERLYRKTERWEELRNLLTRASIEGPASRRAPFWISLGELLATRFSDPGGAAAAFESALDLDATARPALEGLQRIAVESGDDAAVLRAYEREAQGTPEPARLSFLVHEIASRYEAGDRPEDALLWVERLMESSPADRAALETAARLHERLGNMRELTAALERLGELLAGPERAANLHRLAALYVRAQDTDTAIGCWEGILEIEATDRRALEALKPQYLAAQRWEILADVQARLAEILPPAERAQELDELARLLETQLGRPREAIQVLEQLRETGARVDERLEALLEQTGEYEALVDQLARRGATLEADDLKRVVMRRAELLVEPLGRIDDAVITLQALRERLPGDGEVLDALELTVRESGDSQGLVDLLADRAAAAEQPRERARIQLERAILLDEILDDRSRARSVYVELAEADWSGPAGADASSRLVALLSREGDWHAVREHLESRATRGEESETLALHLRVAEICRQHLDDVDGCIEHLETAGRLEPTRRETWEQLAALYGKLGRIDDQVRAHESELETGPAPEREASLRAHLARIAASDPAEPAGRQRAGAHFERVLELDPSHAEAAEFLIDLYDGQGRPADVLRLLALRLASTPTGAAASEPRRQSLLLRMAALQSGPLENQSGAVATLEVALAELGAIAAVAAPLAALYEDRGSLDEAIALSRQAIEAAHDTDERAAWQLRLAASLRQRGVGEDPRDAVDALRAALATRPGDLEAEESLRALYRELGDAGPLADLLRAQLERSQGSDSLEIHLELIDLLAGPLDCAEEALTELQRVLGARPDCAEAFGLAIKLTHSLGRHDEAAELIDGRLDGRLPDAERAGLLEMRADLMAGPLGRVAEAIATYRSALSLEPRRSTARHSLRRALEQLGRWPEVLDCLYLELGNTAPDARGRILEAAVEIASARVDDDTLLPWLDRLRAERPGDPRVLEQISALHRRAGRPQALLRALDAELGECGDVDRKRDLHLESARVLSHELGSPGRAAWALEAALALDPRNPEILLDLDALYRATGRSHKRVGILETRLAALGGADADTEALLRTELAGLLDDELGEVDRALLHWERAAALTPDASPLKPERLRALSAALGSTGAVAARAEVLETELALLRGDTAETLGRRAELHCELIESYEAQLASRDASLGHLRELVDSLDRQSSETPTIAPGQREAMERLLLHHLRADGNFVELEHRLSTYLDRNGTTGPSSCADWLELARLRDERLQSPNAAAAAYRVVLERDPTIVQALRGLRQIGERSGDWPEVARALTSEIDTDDTPAVCGPLQRRLGDVCRHRLQDSGRARRAYGAALEVDSTDLLSLRALEQLCEEAGEWPLALDYYAREIEVLGSREPARRQHVWLRAGELAASHGEDLGHAIECYEKAGQLERDEPGCELFEAGRQRELAELYGRNGQRERYADAMETWCDDSRADARCEDQLAVAECWRELGEIDRAIARATRATASDARDARAWDLAADLYEADGQAELAAEALERAAQMVGATGASERLVRAADHLDGRSIDRAAALLRRAVETDSAFALAHARRADVAERQHDWETAEEAAGRTLDLANGNDTLEAHALLSCALTGGRAARRRENLEAAARFFSQALALEPEHREALESQGEILYQRGDLTSARHVLEQRLELPGDNANKAHHLTIVATGLELEDQLDAAMCRFQEALECNPGFDEAHAGVVRLHEAAHRTDEAVAALERWTETMGDSPGRASQLLHAASLEMEADRRNDAEAHLRLAVEADPSREHAQLRLAQLLFEDERFDGALEASAAGLEHAESDGTRAQLALICGQSREQCGEEAGAIEAYAEARTRDPRCVEAILAEARLLRGRGDWVEAAEALREFADSHPEPDLPALAQVHYKRGRIMAGPLENVEEAIHCYERAVEIEPSLTQAREPLANLLSHYPEKWSQALTHHRLLLGESPTRTSSLRTLLKIARECDDEATRSGLAIARALGIATPSELVEASAELPIRIAERAQLEDPIEERLRQVAQLTTEELAAALPRPSESAVPEGGEGGPAAFRRARWEARRDLAAPGLLDAPIEELTAALTTVAALALEPDSTPTTPLGRSLDQSVGRWTRRKIRKTLEGIELSSIAGVDFEQWRDRMEVLAASLAVDACNGDLRSALLALLAEREGDQVTDLSDSIDLSAALMGAPAAVGLMNRVVRSWTDTIGRSL